jgi:tetrahydromethanopterin S-methyltransferase subunit B
VMGDAQKRMNEIHEQAVNDMQKAIHPQQPAPSSAQVVQKAVVNVRQSTVVNNWPSANDRYLAEQQQANADFGTAVGQAIGGAIARSVQGHRVKKYCKEHPAETWILRSNTGEVLNSGTCASTASPSLSARPISIGAGTNFQSPRTEAAASRWGSRAFCENAGYFWNGNSCHLNPNAGERPDDSQPRPLKTVERKCVESITYPNGEEVCTQYGPNQ